MKTYQLLLGVMLLLTGGACTRHPHRVISAGISVPPPDADDEFVPLTPKVKLRRNAVLEHRYTTEAKCDDAATNYFQKVLGNTGLPAPIAAAPKTYSMKMAGRNREVRFVAGKGADLDVPFAEVEKTADNPNDDTNRQDLNDAIAALGPGVRVLEGPTLDPAPINGKRAWRVVLTSARSAGPDQLMLSGTFGLVINPPYP
ncbi:hypothetical protein GCM10027594_28350 [Hymenobacter agri]